MIVVDDETGEDGGESEGISADESQEVPLPNVKTHVLAKVIDFMTHHVNSPMSQIEKPLRSDNMDIKDLLALSCAKVASLIKGKTPAEIRKTFNITEDFTPAEGIKVRVDDPWLEDV